MSLFVVTYVHPDKERWLELLEQHLEWIEARLADGAIVALGPLPDAAELSALLLIAARDEQQVHAILDSDPYVNQGLVTELTVVRCGRLAEFAGA